MDLSHSGFSHYRQGLAGHSVGEPVKSIGGRTPVLHLQTPYARSPPSSARPSAPIPDRQSSPVQSRSAGDLHPLGPRIRRHLLLPRRLDGCVLPESSQPHRAGPGIAVAEFRQGQSDPEQPLVSGRRPADQRRLGMAAAKALVPARFPSRTHGVVRPHHGRLHRRNAGHLAGRRSPRHPSGNDAAHHAHRRQSAFQRGGESRHGKSGTQRSTS